MEEVITDPILDSNVIALASTGDAVTTGYATGDIALLGGSATVVGTGTTFAATHVGMALVVDGDYDYPYVITGYTDATHITVDKAVHRAVVAHSPAAALTIAGTYSGSGVTPYRVEIDSSTTFRWSDDGGNTWDASAVTITGAAQALNNGVTATFAVTTGHTIGHQWDFAAGFSYEICLLPYTRYRVIADNLCYFSQGVSGEAAAATDTMLPQLRPEIFYTGKDRVYFSVKKHTADVLVRINRCLPA